eukprot:TRINITY_DN8602_c0_g3_i2.p1 TRINITY_DN8602_c0_g3~~TRINITY_DN8602_c0_g3_i2.p1  ORF type:complete len:205 (-),score=29.84 TRINITY_DN8602_c0_g3_i2:151-765(-)
MGNAYSYDTSVPPGGALIFLQSPDECCQTKPQWNQGSRPPVAMDDAAWTNFEQTVRGIVDGYWNELWSALPAIAGMVVALVAFVSTTMSIMGGEMMGGGGGGELMGLGLPLQVVFFILCMLLTMGARFLIVHLNRQQDQKIEAACQELSSKAMVTAQYRTAWTGVCKPRHARTMRAIALSGGGGGYGASQAPIVQGMIVQGQIA